MITNKNIVFVSIESIFDFKSLEKGVNWSFDRLGEQYMIVKLVSTPPIVSQIDKFI